MLNRTQKEKFVKLTPRELLNPFVLVALAADLNQKTLATRVNIPLERLVKIQEKIRKELREKPQVINHTKLTLAKIRQCTRYGSYYSKANELVEVYQHEEKIITVTTNNLQTTYTINYTDSSAILAIKYHQNNNKGVKQDGN